MTQVDVIFHLSPSSLHQVNHVPGTVLEVVLEVERVGVRIDKDRTGQG